MNKKGIELATSTLIVIILAVVMLILGVLLVKNSMCAAIKGVTSINSVIRDEMRNLIIGDGKPVVSKERNNEIARQVPYGVAFMVQNDEKTDTLFDYRVEIASLGDCQITEEVALSYIIIGKEGELRVPVGENYIELITFEIPKDAPLCNLRYNVVVENGNELYGSDSFDVNIKKGSYLTSTFC